jgi:DNA-directed RNA polymerase subunit RPC12/RpoP
MTGRIVLYLDRGLGWTKPLTVADCGICGTELARHPNPDRALRAAGRRRCPGCGSRASRRLPGTTSLAADLTLADGRQRQPQGHYPASGPLRAGRR